MLLTVGTTEAVEAIAEAQENLQEVAKSRDSPHLFSKPCSGSFEFCTAGCHCGHRICSGS